MDVGLRRISPTRWAVFELPPDGAGRPRFWLRRTAATDVVAWAERNLDRLRDVAPDELLRLREDWTLRYRPRTTGLGLRRLRGKVVDAIERSGGVVAPDATVVVYAIELATPAGDGRARLYVGVTSDLERRVAEHAGRVVDGVPGGRAVRRHGFGRLRQDLVAGVPPVSSGSALELEAQVSAWLAHRGFEVHGDGTRRRPRRSNFVHGISWADLVAAYEAANPNVAETGAE